MPDLSNSDVERLAAAVDRRREQSAERHHAQRKTPWGDLIQKVSVGVLTALAVAASIWVLTAGQGVIDSVVTDEDLDGLATEEDLGALEEALDEGVEVAVQERAALKTQIEQVQVAEEDTSREVAVLRELAEAAATASTTNSDRLKDIIREEGPVEVIRGYVVTPVYSDDDDFLVHVEFVRPPWSIRECDFNGAILSALNERGVVETLFEFSPRRRVSADPVVFERRLPLPFGGQVGRYLIEFESDYSCNGVPVGDTDDVAPLIIRQRPRVGSDAPPYVTRTDPRPE